MKPAPTSVVGEMLGDHDVQISDSRENQGLARCVTDPQILARLAGLLVNAKAPATNRGSHHSGGHPKSADTNCTRRRAFGHV